MKNKILFEAILLLLTLVSCAPVSNIVPTNTPDLIALYPTIHLSEDCFLNQAVESVIHLKLCPLKTIIAKLGPPEKVEITILYSDIGGSTDYDQRFHYISLGFSFFRICHEEQDCFAFHPNDFVNAKEFYASNKPIKDSMGFNMATYVYNWHGFDVDVEGIENKIRDFATKTPRP